MIPIPRDVSSPVSMGAQSMDDDTSNGGSSTTTGSTSSASWASGSPRSVMCKMVHSPKLAVKESINCLEEELAKVFRPKPKKRGVGQKKGLKTNQATVSVDNEMMFQEQEQPKEELILVPATVFDDSNSEAQQECDIGPDSSEADISQAARVRFGLGEVELKNGCYEKAARNFSAARCALSIKFGPLDKKVAQAYERMGDVEVARGDLGGTNSTKHYDAALEIYRQGTTVQGKQELARREADAAMSNILLKQAGLYCTGEGEDKGKGLAKYKEALQILRRSQEDSSKAVTDVLIQMGQLALRRNDDETALRVFAEATTSKTLEQAAGDRQDFVSIYRSMGQIFYRRGDYYTALHHFKIALEGTQSAVGSSVHPDVATILREMGETSIEIEQYEDALSSLGEALHIMHNTVFDFEDATTITEKLAFVERKLGRRENAITRYKDLLHYSVEVFGGEDSEEVAEIYHKLGRKSLDIEDTKSALSYFRKEGRIRQKIGSDERQIFTVLSILGSVNGKKGAIEKASKYFSDAMDVLSEYGRTHHGEPAFSSLARKLDACEDAVKSQKDPTSMCFLPVKTYTDAVSEFGGVLMARGCFDEAISCYQSGLRLFDEAGPSDAKQILQLKHHLGLTYIELGNYSAALETLQAVLKGQEGVYGDDSFELVSTMNRLGHVYLSLGSYDEAVRMFDRALGAKMSLHEDADAEFFRIRTSLGLAFQRKEHFDMAMDTFEEVLRRQGDVLGHDHLDVACTLELQGNLYLAMSQFDEALLTFTEALKLRGAALGKYHPLIGKTMTRMASLHLDAKRYLLAHKHCLEALNTLKQSALSPGHPYMQEVKFVMLRLDSALKEEQASLLN